MYGRLFGASLEKYNEKQMAAGKQNRCITDYYQKIFDAWRRDEAKIDGKTKRRSNVAHPCYEYVLQIGNRETWKQLTVEQDEEILEDAARRIQARTAGAIEWFQIAYHVDEKDGTPHIHMAGVPYSTGNRRGLETQVSMGGALKKLRLARLPDLQELMMKELEGKTAEAKKEAAAAKEEAVREAEKTRANAQAEAARTKERAETAAKSTKEAAEAEAGRTRAQAKKEAEKAKEDAAADVQKLREQAEREVQKQRNYAKWLGEEGDGIRWKRSNGSTYDEKSVKQVRAERDAVQAEADAAMKKKDELLAFADEIRGERYEIDGRTYKGISALAEDLKGMRAETAAAQDAAQGTEQRLAHAKADLQETLAEAAKAKQARDRYARERLIDWTEIDSAIAGFARFVATVVVSLWDSARDFAVSVWQSWRGNWGLSITSSLGYSKQDHENVCDEQMASACEERNRPDIAHALGVDEEREERGYDDWER